MADRPQHVIVGLWLAAALVPASGAEAQPAAGGQGETDWPSVITRLRQETHQHPGHAQLREQLAIAYNNYGVSLGEQGQWDLAVRQLQEALVLEPANADFKENLSSMYYRQADEAYSRSQLEEATVLLDHAIALTPDVAQLHALRGEIEYQRQNLKAAKQFWQRAVELDPAQAELAERLAQVTEELPVESNFERLSQASFDLRYEEALERPVGFNIRDALLDARREVGSDFSYWPKRKLVVLIYGAESFRKLRQETPEWVAGQFDGKIRVPYPSEQLDPATVRQILFHEYTHAIIHDLTQERCPLWLNEGLAEYEGRTQRRGVLHFLKQAHDEGRLIPLSQLSDQISASSEKEQVGLAYEQSYSLAAYLVDRYGFWRIRKLLSDIAQGRPWEEVFAQEFHMKLSRLEANWREWLPGFLSTHR